MAFVRSLARPPAALAPRLQLQMALVPPVAVGAAVVPATWIIVQIDSGRSERKWLNNRAAAMVGTATLAAHFKVPLQCRLAVSRSRYICVDLGALAKPINWRPSGDSFARPPGAR